jgi:hypothetical protein
MKNIIYQNNTWSEKLKVTLTEAEKQLLTTVSEDEETKAAISALNDEVLAKSYKSLSKSDVKSLESLLKVELEKTTLANITFLHAILFLDFDTSDIIGVITYTETVDGKEVMGRKEFAPKLVK